MRILCVRGEASILLFFVRSGGVEPPHPKALPPEDSVSTNFTTSAMHHCSAKLIKILKGSQLFIQDRKPVAASSAHLFHPI